MHGYVESFKTKLITDGVGLSHFEVLSVLVSVDDATDPDEIVVVIVVVDSTDADESVVGAVVNVELLLMVALA